MADTALKDQNDVSSLIAASSSDATIPVKLYANPTTHRLLVDFGGASTPTTWATTGNTNTVTDSAVSATSMVLIQYTSIPNGNWKIVAGSGSFVITSSDSESAGMGFIYKVLP